MYKTKKKNGLTYYRSSITYKNKHISLGSSDSFDAANQKYELATKILRDHSYLLKDYNENTMSLDYEKWVSLLNFRDSEDILNECVTVPNESLKFIHRHHDNMIYNEVYPYMWLLCIYIVVVTFIILANLWLLIRVLNQLGGLYVSSETPIIISS